MTYGQLKDGITNYKDFDKAVSMELKKHPFIFIRKGDAKKVRGMYHKGFTVSDAISYFIMRKPTNNETNS